jgi:hypothetical protein
MARVPLLALLAMLGLAATAPAAAQAAAPRAGEDPVGAPDSLRALDPGEWRIQALPCVIQQPGRYVLEWDLSLPPPPLEAGVNFGIIIRADHVDLDLAGHELVGVEGSVNGIAVLPALRRTDCADVRVHDGTVRNWGGFGLDLQLAREVRLDDLFVANNGLPQQPGGGVRVGNGAQVQRCALRLNALIGLQAGLGAVLTEVQCVGNTTHGLVTGDLAMIRACTATQNGGDGIVLDGSGGLVTDCMAGANGRSGLRVGRGTFVRDTSAWGNQRAGLIVSDACSVSGCLLADNGTDGVSVVGARNRIADNHMAQNELGLNVTGGGNLLVRNSLGGNTRPLQLWPGNTTGGLYEAPRPDAIPAGPPSNEPPALPPWGNVIH